MPQGLRWSHIRRKLRPVHPFLLATLSLVAPCPAAQALPQLTILELDPAAVPLARYAAVESWQVFLEGAPLSDAQVAALAGDEILGDELQVELEERGMRVYGGLIAAALGAGVSSVGWTLFGQDRLDQQVTLPLALGGLVLGVGGLLFVNHTIQTPLEPYVAPTPTHRMSREQARELVSVVNRRWLNQVCAQ